MNPIAFFRLTFVLISSISLGRSQGLVGSGAGAAPATSSATAEIDRAMALLQRHRSGTGRLFASAELTARAILDGGHYYLAGDKVWVAEGVTRAGGTAAAKVLEDSALAKPGDVVWLAYPATGYQEWMDLAGNLEHRGCLVIYFGPAPPRSAQARGRWIDSLTRSDSSHRFVLLGNNISLWAETGELASATARRGKTLVFLQSHVLMGSFDREKLDQGLVWHAGWPRMKPVPAGTLAKAYLDDAIGLIGELRSHELSKISRLGRDLARRAASGRPAVMMAAGGHIMPHVIASGGPFRRGDTVETPAELEAMLKGGDLVVFFGYVSVPFDFLRSVHRAGATAAWIVSPLPQDVDFGEFGDTVIDQEWKIGDADVQVPGYDIRILPPSGIVELVRVGPDSVRWLHRR